jgi:hypothetical protein
MVLSVQNILKICAGIRTAHVYIERVKFFSMLLVHEAACCSLYRTAMYLNAPNLVSALLVGFTWLTFFLHLCALR